MVSQKERLRAFFNNRWLVLVASIWVQSCAGVGYLFGSISPVIKSTMGYNQKQISYLGVAKNLGDCIGAFSGVLSEIFPFWGVLFVGVLQNFIGYGFLWLIITNRWTTFPLWGLCIAIFVGNNGETYYNTASLLSCLTNFPDNRGPVVGILKGFAGLSGAIISQIYHMFSTSNRDSLILAIAMGPSTVVLTLMFAIRHVEGYRQKRPSDNLSFSFVYGICLLLAAYLMASLLLEDLNQSLIMICSIILPIILLLPLIVPVTLTVSQEVHDQINESLLPESCTIKHETHENGITKYERGPQLGEDFTFRQTLATPEFWLMFVSVVLGSGCGITIIDNMGQICESLDYTNTRIFISIISICNFLGRVGGGYFSELVVRNYAYPRLVAMAIVQIIMAIGLLYYAMEWPAAIYTLTVVTSLGYGAHWGIVLAAITEMFGLKSFGASYNFVTLAMPIGSLILSSGVTSRIYDYYAEVQTAAMTSHSQLRDEASLTCMGSICYSTTCAILSGVLCVAVVLTLIVVRRTTSVYTNLYATSQT